MKTKKVFWGSLLITIGLLIIGRNFDLLNWNLEFAWDFWPLLFVLWGLSILAKNTFLKPVASFVFGVYFAVTVFGMVTSFSERNYFYINGDSSTRIFHTDYADSLKEAELNFSSVASNIFIKSPTYGLAHIEVKGIGNYYLNTHVIDSTVTATFDSINDFSFFARCSKRNTINLNKNPIWNLTLDIGASKGKFDLSYYKLKKLTINTGATNLTMKLGNRYPETTAEINMGVAKLEIYIPESSACKIETDLALSKKELENFNKDSQGNYITENFNTAQNKIIIKITGAVSAFEVNRY